VEVPVTYAEDAVVARARFESGPLAGELRCERRIPVAQ
jgi:hypothetical protein